jgi:hypothetical protein
VRQICSILFGVLLLGLPHPLHAQAPTELSVDQLAEVLLSAEDLGPEYREVTPGRVPEADWLLLVLRGFEAVPPPADRRDLPHVVGSAVGWLREIEPEEGFERFVAEYVYHPDNPQHFHPLEGPEVGDQSEWWATEQPWVVRDPDADRSVEVPHMILALVFRVDDYVALVVTSGSPERVAEIDLHGYAEIMVDRLQALKMSEEPLTEADSSP